MRIGVVGLGAMGKRIAYRLIKAGHELTVWDRDPPEVELVVAAGARPADSVSEALQGEMVISVLFDDDAIRTVLLNSNGLEKAAQGLIHVCMSTITMAFARELEAYHATQRVAFVGAPMLGRPEVIEAGGLNILAAGNPALLDRVEAPLACLGKFWRLGSDPTEGYVGKLAANFMISGAIEAMAEAVAVLKAHGANAERFISILGETLFASFVYKSYGPMVAGKAPPTPSGLALPIKDNASFLKAAAGTGVHVPLAEAVRANFARAVEQGAKDDDWSTALANVAQGKARLTT